MRALALIFTLLNANDEYARFITAASRLFENLEYERALEQLSNAKKNAKTADEQTEVALYEGVVLLELGRSDDARAALQTALFLSPDAKVPVKVSPKVAAQVEAIRAQVKKELAPILEKRKAEEAAKLAHVEPLKPPPEPVKPPPPPTEPKVVVKKDEPVREPASEAPPKLEPKPVTEEPPQIVEQPVVRKSKGVPVVSLILVGAGGGTAIAAAIFGSQANALVDEAHKAEFQNDAQAKLDEARPKATVANVLFGVTGALATAAVISAIVWAAAE